MPVNILYCEGLSKSRDISVIKTLFSDVMTKPIGSKHGLSKRIIGARAGSDTAFANDGITNTEPDPGKNHHRDVISQRIS